MTVEELLRDTLEHKASTVHVADDGWSRIEAGVNRKRTARLFVPAVAFAAVLAVLVVTLAIAGRGDHASVVVGPTGKAAAKVRLVFMQLGPRPTADVVDAATGAKKTVQLPDLLQGVGGAQALSVGDSIVVQNAKTVFALPATLDGPARTLGFADSVFASAAPDKIWMVSSGAGTPSDQSSATVREVDLTGKDVSPTRPVPPGFEPRAAVTDGLAGEQTTMEGGAHRNLLVWDPVTGQTKRSFGTDDPAFLAAGHTVVAWIENVRGHRLHLTDTVSGADRIVASPAGLQLAGGATLSPDASTIVVVSATRAKPHQLAMAAIDVATGKAQELSGWQLGVGKGFGWDGPGWSPDSATLFFATPSQLGGDGKAYLYRRSGTAIMQSRVTLGPFDTSVAVPGE